MSYISDKIERDAQHKYTTPIGPLASVTTITNVIDAGKSGALVGWAVRETCNYIEKCLPTEAEALIGMPTLRDVIARARKESAKQRDEAANIGKIVHDMAEMWGQAHLKGVPFETGIDADTNPLVVQAWNAFMEFVARTGVRPSITEMMVYSRKHKYAGTFDLVAQGKYPHMRLAKNYLIDYKTGTVVPKSHGPQLAAYAQAYEEMTGETVDGIAVLALDKVTGEPTWVDFSKDRSKHWRVFKSAVKLYEALNNGKRGGRRT